jgi:hypothetical protein
MLQIKIEHSVFLCDFLDRKLVILMRGILQGHALRMRGAFLVASLKGIPVPRSWALEMSPFFIFFVKNGTKDHSMKYSR